MHCIIIHYFKCFVFVLYNITIINVRAIGRRRFYCTKLRIFCFVLLMTIVLRMQAHIPRTTDPLIEVDGFSRQARVRFGQRRWQTITHIHMHNSTVQCSTAVHTHEREEESDMVEERLNTVNNNNPQVLLHKSFDIITIMSIKAYFVLSEL